MRHVDDNDSSYIDRDLALSKESTDMTDKCTFGIKKPCTTEQFEDEVSDFYSKCTLKDVGEFYFCYGEPTKADEKKFYVHLKFHDKDESVLHTSTSSPFNIGKGTYPITSIAIDKGTFVFGTETWGHVCFLNDSWSTSELVSLSIGRKALGNAILDRSPKSPPTSLESEQARLETSSLSATRGKR